MKTDSKMYKDLHNYLIWTDDIHGEWSDPVYLNSTGFDPSLFHDPNTGKKWMVNMQLDYRTGHPKFGGIVLQEYDPQERKLVGDIYPIFQGSSLGTTEGPHLYAENEYYYLITAEGGTGYQHAITLARSKKITGPYQLGPNSTFLTSAGNPEYPLQKAGHGDLVQAPDGSWYLVHLASRPFPGTRNCLLGRETFLQNIEWTRDGWLQLCGGDVLPKETYQLPGRQTEMPEDTGWVDSFDAHCLSMRYQTPYAPLQPDQFSLTARKGWLRLYGRESINSHFCQTMLAVRLEHFHCTFTAGFDYHPKNYFQMAGIVILHDMDNYTYFRITNLGNGRCLGIISYHNGIFSSDTEELSLGEDPVELCAKVEGRRLRFLYRTASGGDWVMIPKEFDTVFYTDDYSTVNSYTGSFAAVSVQDLSGSGLYADISWISYVPKVLK